VTKEILEHTTDNVNIDVFTVLNNNKANTSTTNSIVEQMEGFDEGAKFGGILVMPTTME